MNEEEEKKLSLITRIDVTLDGLIDQHKSLEERTIIPINEYTKSLNEKRKVIIGAVIFVAVLILGLGSLNSLKSPLIEILIIDDVLIGIVLYIVIGYLITKVSEYRNSIIESYIGIIERMYFLKGFLIAGSKNLDKLDDTFLSNYLNFSSLNCAAKFVSTLNEYEKMSKSIVCPKKLKARINSILKDNLVFLELAKKQSEQFKMNFQSDKMLSQFLPSLQPLNDFNLKKWTNLLTQGERQT